MFLTQTLILVQLFYFRPVAGLSAIFPVVDLNYIRAVCQEDVSHDYVDQQIEAVHTCLGLIPDQLTESTAGVIECKYSSAYLRCYAFATELLNTCEDGRGRGDVLRRIHEAVHTQMCTDGGAMLKSAFQDSTHSTVPGDGTCPPAYNTTTECISEEAYDSWESADVCISFNALFSCQEAALLQSNSSSPSSFPNCGDLPLTQLILQRLRAAQRDLGCVPGLNGSTTTTSIMGGDADADDGSFASLFPNPRQELIRLQSYCETRQQSVGGIQSSLDEARRCLEQELQSVSADQCQLIEARDRCWTPITTKLNECIRGRGDTVTRIYTEMVRVTCLKREELAALPVTEKCVADIGVPACKTTTMSGEGEDICKVFQAKRACLNDAIGNCQHERHKAVVEATLEQVRGNLGGCQVPTSGPDSSSTSCQAVAGLPWLVILILMCSHFLY